MFKWYGALIAVAALLLAGCGMIAPTPTPGQVELLVQMSMNDSGEAYFKIGGKNVGGRVFESKDFGGVVRVEGENGPLRLKVELHQLGPLEPGQSDMPSGYRGVLDPGSYTLSYTAPGSTPLSVPFKIVEREGKCIMQVSSQYIEPFTNYTEANE